MEFRDAVKYLRSELGYTQIDLATALHVTPLTVGRWENGKNLPTRSLSAVIMKFANEKGVSADCVNVLKSAITKAAKEKLNKTGDPLSLVEHASLRQLIDDASFPIYVCDIKTDQILYLNQKAFSMAGRNEPVIGKVCYECLMHRSTPCDFCHKDELVEDYFTCREVMRPFDNTSYMMQGKRIKWNGRDAHVMYITEADSGKHLKSIVENINGGVSAVVYGDDGRVRIAYANDRYYTIFGYSKEQFFAELKNPHDTIYSEDSKYVGEIITKVKSTCQAANFRYRIHKRDGSTAYINCSSSMSSIPGLGDKVLISVLTDVTATVEAEQNTLVLGQRLDAIMKNISNAVTAVTVGDNGSLDVLFSNELYYEILGYTRAQYRKEVSDPFSVVFADDADAVRRAVIGASHIGDTKKLQYRVVTRDGRIKWLRTRISVLSFPDQKKPVQLTVYSDITDMADAVEQITAQRNEITDIFNTTPSGIAVAEVDPDDIMGSFHITFFNDRFYSFSGYTREEYDDMLKSNEMGLVFDEDAPSLLTQIRLLCEGNIGDTGTSTIRSHTKDGGYRWLLLTGQFAEKRDNKCIFKISMVDVTARKEAEESSRISEEMLRIAAETDKRAIIIFDVKANTCRVESRNLFSAKYGMIIENVPESLIELGITAPDSIVEFSALFDRIRGGEERVSVSLQLRTGTAEYQWFECNAAVVFDAEGNPDHAVLVFHNVTEQRVKEAVFKKWKQSIETRPQNSYTLFRCNLSRDAGLDEREGNLLNVRFSETSMSFNARTEEYATQYVYPDDREAYISLLDADALLAFYYRGNHETSLEYREMSEDGELSWRLLTVELVEYLNSSDVQAFLMYEDINERKIVELKEKEMAETDPLTGVLNRTAFAERVDELIGREAGSQHAFLMLDMDGFKLLNDTFGHAAGDQALMDVTAVLRSLIRDGDLIGRLGGDEFLIWLREIPYDAVIGKMALQMCEQVRKVFSNKVQISASIGVSVYPRDGRTFDELYHTADKALYSVKQGGKDNYAFYSTIAAETAVDITNEPNNLPRAIAKTKRRMLIVDDNETNRTLLTEIFKDDYQIEHAKNGADAMIQLRHFSTAITVVLLDLIMPGMDGFEVLRKMQSNIDLMTIPVIVVSGDDNHETLLRAIDYGAADFVTKPVDAEFIRIRVKSAVSKAENERLRAQNSYLQLQRDEELKFHTVLDSTGTVVVEYDWRNHVFIYDNSIAKYIDGNFKNNRGLWSVFLADMVADSSDVKMLQEMLLSLENDREKSKASKLVLLQTPQKLKHWFRMNVYKQVDAFGLAEKMIITFNDVHEEVLANDKLIYQAQRDELTGLYNRYGFIQKATELIQTHAEGYYVMTSVDIERFKVINDQFGTQRGDEVLKKLAGALSLLYEADGGICCRVNADNFAMLFPEKLLGTPKLEQAHMDMARLCGAAFPVKFSIGRCVVDDKSLDVSAIYDRACLAKETVKGRFDKSIATYDESMRTALLRQQEIIGQMNHALESGQFEVWLQPQFNHSNGKLCGAEALVRWRHPKEGIISPAEFIPLFERNGFVYEVDKFVWEQVCILLRKWLDLGLNPVPISVNISRYDVFRKDLIDVICGLVKKYDLPFDLMRLEITESAFSESADQIIHVVEEFVRLGFVVEIDDFGSGYSSLNTLKDVPAQVIKMDMRFLENDNNAQRGGSIIESVVRMARWLGMTVIAEGVETIEQADYLLSIGCDYIQGYLYSRPTQVVEYEKLFAEGKFDSKLSKLQAMESWNNNAFWNPKSMESLIFNSYVGGACIFEYHKGTTEILRTNADFKNELRGLVDNNEKLRKTDFTDLLDEDNQARLDDTVKKSVNSKEQTSCELTLSRNGQTEYVRITIRMIASTSDRMLFYAVILNMTEQRDAEKKQMESARQLETVMNNVNGGVSALLISDEGASHFVFNNERYYELYGYTRAQAEEENLDVMSLIVPEDFPSVMEKIARLKADKKPTVIDYRCKRRDGRMALLRANCSLMHMNGYGDDVITSVLTDVTEQRELSDKFKAVVENINGGVSATYLRGNKPEYVIVNERYYELIGYTKEQFAKEVKNVFELIYPDDRERIEKQFTEASTHQGQYSMEYRFIRRDGKVRNILCNTNVIHLFGVDEPVQLAVSTDITELRESQQKVVETADKLQAVLSHAGNGMAAIALRKDNPEFLFANGKYYEISGYSEEEYPQNTTKDIFALIHPDDREESLKKIKGLTEKDGSVSLEYRIIRGDGKVVWIRSVVTITYMKGIDVPVQIAMFADITEEVKANEQLRFLNSMAHDILAQPDCDKAINNTLGELMNYFGAGRGYVVELDLAQNISFNTYEVCADGVSSEKENLQSIPFGPDDFWYDSLTRHEYFIIEDVDALCSEKADLKELLKSQGIHSIIVAGLWKEGRLIGFAGVDNPTRNIEQVSRLTALSDYIAILLTRRDLLLSIERESKAMKRLIDDTPGGFCRMAIHKDASPTLVTLNDGFCSMLGMSEEEVRAECGDDMYRCLMTEDLAVATEDSKDAHFDGGQFSTKCRLRRKDGSLIWVMVFGRFVIGEAGNVYLNSYFTDITEQKKAEEQQKELLDNLPQGAALYEYDGKKISAIHINKRYWELVGRDPVDYAKSSVLDVIYPDDRILLERELNACLKQNRIMSVTVRILYGEKEYRPFNIKAKHVRRESGTYLFYASYTPQKAE